MSLGGHLRELRNRIAVSLLAVAVAGSVGWIYYSPLLHKLQEPIREVARARHTDFVGLNFGASGITAPFAIKLKVAMFVGLLIASPVWIYELLGVHHAGPDQEGEALRRQLSRRVGAACSWAAPCWPGGSSPRLS